MGLFKKLKDVLEANISDLISKAEDPEKMLNLYVERATEELKQFNIQVNRAVADQLQLRQKAEASKKEIESWNTQAKVAITQNRDDLARIALERKKTAENNLAEYEAQLAEQEKAVETLRSNYRLLEEKLNKARSERDQLVMRQRRAAAMKQANEAVQEIASNNALSDFDRMRDKVNRSEAEAQATMISAENSLEDEFAKLKKSADDMAVDDELARLKAELGKGKE
ncbi:MAG: Phage shock protein A [Pelotomaculum sp. PtaB.Bin013]|uniref:PspA/IM30 family protein n=1 Tax=Pelotomaculum isophthalicicum JI TaxID=947010 RepID=A0A9X4H2J1_9FIRM|nr:PspA/IM30 family protein [Pelotomaculum isophthalicicum]MDF9408946.1 PspA/IM30 family protein [Pelotomaculum isophthalicicum JI]OPX87990.1 MAG: Phage shock protein A [Pelotomaculum sp. PtaB.Bin013]